MRLCCVEEDHIRLNNIIDIQKSMTETWLFKRSFGYGGNVLWTFVGVVTKEDKVYKGQSNCN